MAIYTKTGDKGTTSLFGGKRLSKGDMRVEAYGKLDELTSFLGLLRAKLKSNKDKLILIDVQKDLYEIMAVLSGAKNNLSYLDKKTRIFEEYIDEVESKLPKLFRFILPGENELSALFHINRALCRSAEREIVRLYKKQQITDEKTQFLIIRYINRLSDLFFDLSRMYSKERDIQT